VLIPRESLILPQSRESAEVRAQPYSSGAHRPCSARAITRTPIGLIKFVELLERRFVKFRPRFILVVIK
jgi:hypothetical protein